MMCKKNCDNCKHCFVDATVNYSECTNEKALKNMTEEEVVKYFENCEDGCPYFEKGNGTYKYGYVF